eukprot:338384-Amorphochlora_amoeboformis.AAC.1
MSKQYKLPNTPAMSFVNANNSRRSLQKPPKTPEQTQRIQTSLTLRAKRPTKTTMGAPRGQ